MNIIKRISDALKFDEGDDRFELLEAEKGEPKLFGKWRDVPEKRRRTDDKLSSSLAKNEKRLRSVFDPEINTDLIIRRFLTGCGTEAMLVYMNGMAKDETISRFIMEPLMSCTEDGGGDIGYILSCLVRIPESTAVKRVDEITEAVSDGKTALFIDGERGAAVLETRGYEKRGVEATENEKIVLGPKEGFTESLRTNITLIRRIIRTNDLVVRYFRTGGENNTSLALVYRKGFTSPSLIAEIASRIERMKGKLIVSTGVIEQLIEDDSISPLPQSLSTERPDRVSSFIMEGACAVISEGSPYALVLPATVSALLSSPEDTYMRRPLGSVLRLVRYIGAAASILLPGYFVALAMYHQGLLSTEVLSTVIKSREMVFEPLPFEMLLLLFIFQLIREAGMRVPSSVGQAIGVIGGLILGQAAVAANLASTVILIIVAISGLGNLCIPDYSTQVAAAYFRFAFVLAAWLGGLLGLTCAVMLFVSYMANLKSFGVPFLAPFAPKTGKKRPFIVRGRITQHTRAEDYYNTADDSRLRTEKEGENTV